MTAKTLEELTEQNKDKLLNFKYSKYGTELKPNFFVRYIRKSDDKLVKGGKLVSIKYDKLDKSKIYQLTWETNSHRRWTIKFNNIYLFYRKESVAELRKQLTEEWKKNLTPEEKKKWNEYQKDKNAVSKHKFYNWYNEKHNAKNNKNI